MKVERVSGAELLFNYYSNGLQISSALFFPELAVSADRKSQVSIRLGKVPQRLDDATIVRPLHQISQNDFLLEVKNVARFLVANGSEITIEPYEGSSEEDIRAYVLSTLLGVVLHKQNVLALHASSVRAGDKAVIICGHSTAGKSTLALGLYHKGYEVLNDDISTVFFDEESSPLVHSGYTHLKLWAESLEQYSYETNDFRQLRDSLEKYSFPLEKNDQHEAVPVKAVLFLYADNRREIEHEQLKGLVPFELLRTHTFRPKLVKDFGKLPVHFELCSKLVNKVTMIKVCRPNDVSPVVFADYVNKLLEEV